MGGCRRVCWHRAGALVVMFALLARAFSTCLVTSLTLSKLVYKLPDTTAEDFLLGGMPRKEEALKKEAAKKAAAKKAKAAADGAGIDTEFNHFLCGPTGSIC